MPRREERTVHTVWTENSVFQWFTLNGALAEGRTEITRRSRDRQQGWDVFGHLVEVPSSQTEAEPTEGQPLIMRMVEGFARSSLVQHYVQDRMVMH